MTASRLRVLFAAVVLGVNGVAGLGPAAPAPAGPSDDQLKEKALKLNELTNDDAMQGRLLELLKNKDEAKRLVAAAAKVQKAAADKESPFKFNAALVLAKLAHNVKDYDSSEAFYKVCADSASKLKSGKRMLRAYEGLMDLYWEQKKFESVEEVARKFVDAREDKLDFETLMVLERMAQAKAKQGDTDEALKMVDGLTQLPRVGWLFVQTRGWIYREAGKLPDAIAAYEEFIEKVGAAKEVEEKERERMQKNTRYLLTGLYVDQKQIDKAAESLQKLIKADPDNPTFHNDLGFIWADNDKNLDESEKMIRKALELDTKQRQKLLDEGKITEDLAKRENGAYLDSLGWVLFKQKKYKDALGYLQKAAGDEDEGQHIEIWDHLADCQLALGQKKEAAATWEKAIKFEDVSKRDGDRRKKVAEKLKKLKAETAAK
jgi:tetratricopeptide (TPR) repeat protein